MRHYSGPITREESKRPMALVALGGHAFLTPGERGTIKEHRNNADYICNQLMLLIDRGYNVVVTHGNGPQVGNLLLQNESTNDVPPMPLDVLVAQTEGSLGYILQQSMLNSVRQRRARRYVVTVICQVLVDPDDPAFAHPSKPIGPFLSQEVAQARANQLGWVVAEEKERGWRRRVPSPHPLKIVQRHMIRDAAEQGHIVIAVGGGGIPIVKDPGTGNYRGVEAVVDKDLTSSILATEIEADLFVILTEVPQVYANFGTPEQRAFGALTISMVEKHIADGHFPKGSMGPKIEAVLSFLKAGGKRGLITNPASFPEALEGAAGTHFVGRC